MREAAISDTISDSDLRQALLATWRLTSFQVDMDGTVAKPYNLEFGLSPSMSGANWTRSVVLDGDVDCGRRRGEPDQ